MSQDSVWHFLNRMGIHRYESAGDVAAEESAPIARILHTILDYAIRDGASHIHIEPLLLREPFSWHDAESGAEMHLETSSIAVVVRYRIDGVLHEQMKIPQHVMNPLVSRIKIMADMNIAERRVPQDGRIHIKLQDKDFDLRVSTCPTAYGEKVVIEVNAAPQL